MLMKYWMWMKFVLSLEIQIQPLRGW